LSSSDAEGSVKTCFVAMPITTPEAYTAKLGDPNHFSHVLTHLFTPALQAAGLKVIAPSVTGSEIIHAEIIKNLEQADFVLCDLSDLNPNVLYELGIRTSLDRPVMHVRDDLTGKIPFDIAAINTHTYDSSLTPWSLASEIPRLTDFIKGVTGNGNPGNAMWRYFGLTKRGTPSEPGANPVEEKLDLVLRELSKQGQTSNYSTIDQMASLRLVKSNTEMADLLSPIMFRRGMPAFSAGPIRKDARGRMTLKIGVPEDMEPDASLMTDIHDVLRDAGFDDVNVTLMPENYEDSLR
jgi:hypothetical protein